MTGVVSYGGETSDRSVGDDDKWDDGSGVEGDQGDGGRGGGRNGPVTAVVCLGNDAAEVGDEGAGFTDLCCRAIPTDTLDDLAANAADTGAV